MAILSTIDQVLSSLRRSKYSIIPSANVLLHQFLCWWICVVDLLIWHHFHASLEKVYKRVSYSNSYQRMVSVIEGRIVLEEGTNLRSSLWNQFKTHPNLKLSLCFRQQNFSEAVIRRLQSSTHGPWNRKNVENIFLIRIPASVSLEIPG